MSKNKTIWRTDTPEDHLVGLIDVGNGYRTAIFIDNEWHDFEQGKGWTYQDVKRYIPISVFDRLDLVDLKNTDDEFSKIVKQIEDEWDYSGLSETIYEDFARECFNRYLKLIINNKKQRP